ncbi:nucleotide-diphospho-sugar transferase [Mariannaea sp. PMI_226]|nr:nucleotide-diphospho-sugar transferase [Mariannaea sp. PMI_226]
MLNSRRAVVAAIFILTFFFLLSRSHDSSNASPAKPAAAPADAPDSNNAAPPPSNPKSQPPLAELKKTEDQKTLRLRPSADMSGASIYDKLAYAYPYDVEIKFPAYLWQTWKQSADDANFKFKDQLNSWRYWHPGFIHEVITDNDAVNLLHLLYATTPEVLEAYDALPMPVIKADFFRYLILFARGGIYSDIDTWAIQSAAKWIPEHIPHETIGLVIGIEADPDRPDWADWYSRRIQFCQWTIQSKPGHPVLRDIIARITKTALEYKRTGKFVNFKDKDVVELSGPAIWTDIIMEYFNDERFFDMKSSKGKIDYHNFTGMEEGRRVGDVVVLPITSFSPGVGQMGAKEPDDPMAFVKHDFEGTWKPEWLRHIGDEPEVELLDKNVVVH